MWLVSYQAMAANQRLTRAKGRLPPAAGTADDAGLEVARHWTGYMYAVDRKGFRDCRSRVRARDLGAQMARATRLLGTNGDGFGKAGCVG